MSNTFSVIGRIIYAFTIGFFGVTQLMNAASVAGTVPPFLSSVAIPFVYFTGICLVAAAISILINKWTMWSGFFLAMFLILVVLTVDIPHLPDQTAMTMIVKDSAMAGAALFIAGDARS